MSARVLDCPQCGASVNFQSSIAVFAVCEHCRSMIVLRGADAELIGVMAALPPDLSPFQIGTRGEWKGRGFEIVGRIRVEWEQGSWNEWCLLYDAQTIGWLAEAQGLLMISFATTVPEEIPSQPGDYEAKRQVTLDGRTWTVLDRKTTTYGASEGELPFPAPPQQTRLSADLSDAKGHFASIEISEDGPELYLGEYTEFEALKLTNLRPVPGWSTEIEQEKNQTTALSCPACGAAVNLRAQGQSMSAVCGSCAAVIDTATPEFKLIEQADAAVKKLAPLLPIGQRGKLFGTDYEVIGLVKRKDKWSKWFEYLLFNPWEGFRWLVSFQGHWSFVTRLPSMPDQSWKLVRFNGRGYKLFAQGEAKVTGVLGEFYWKVRRGERATISDYIAPPFILSQETYPDAAEVTWSRGEYINRQVIADAFGVEKLPRPEGIYLNEPNRFKARFKEIRVLFFLALFALCLIQLVSMVRRQELAVAEASFVFDRAQTARPPSNPSAPGAVALEAEKVLVTPHFTLQGGEQRVAVEATAPVSNNWVGLELDLVNTKTNASFPATVEISAYHGQSSDGAWSEGSQRASVSFSGVPPGEYFLAIEPSADASIQTIPFTVRVRAGGVFNSNFLLMLGLVLFYPVILLWRGYNFEKRRWAESDFAPETE